MSNKPNIVWIVSDDTNDGMLGYTGGKMLTPTIDSIARNGIAFTQFHSVAPACGPSRYSYLTGHYPGRSPHEELQTTEQYMLFFNAYLYPDKERSVAHVIRQAGYRTGFVGKCCWRDISTLGLVAPMRTRSGRPKPSMRRHKRSYETLSPMR